MARTLLGGVSLWSSIETRRDDFWLMVVPEPSGSALLLLLTPLLRRRVRNRYRQDAPC